MKGVFEFVLDGEAESLQMYVNAEAIHWLTWSRPYDKPLKALASKWIRCAFAWIRLLSITRLTARSEPALKQSDAEQNRKKNQGSDLKNSRWFRDKTYDSFSEANTAAADTVLEHFCPVNLQNSAKLPHRRLSTISTQLFVRVCQYSQLVT